MLDFFFQNSPKLFTAGDEAASFELKNWRIDFWPGEFRKVRFPSLTLEHSNFGSNPNEKMVSYEKQFKIWNTKSFQENTNLLGIDWNFHLQILELEKHPEAFVRNVFREEELQISIEKDKKIIFLKK